MAYKRRTTRSASSSSGFSADRGPEQTDFRDALPEGQTTRKDYFPTLDAYLEYISQAPTCPWPKSRSLNTSVDFFGTASFAATLDLARHGWPEGTTKARTYSAQLGAALDHIDVAEDWRRTVTGGGNIDIAAFNQGLPDCFLSFEPIDDERRFVSIQYNARLQGSTSQESCIKRGVMVAAVIDALESQGYRTQVKFAFANAGHANYQLEVYVTVKQYSESLDLDKIVFLLANPSAHRRLNWAYKELLPWQERGFLSVGETDSSGYGSGAQLTDAADLSFNEHNDYPNVDAAAAAIRAILSKYSVTV